MKCPFNWETFRNCELKIAACIMVEFSTVRLESYLLSVLDLKMGSDLSQRECILQ